MRLSGVLSAVGLEYKLDRRKFPFRSLRWAEATREGRNEGLRTGLDCSVIPILFGLLSICHPFLALVTFVIYDSGPGVKAS